MMAKDNSSEIGFEKQIWDAADELRGSMDAAEYKHVVLGLIFLKYLSDKFEERYQELVNDGNGFELDLHISGSTEEGTTSLETGRIEEETEDERDERNDN